MSSIEKDSEKKPVSLLKNETKHKKETSHEKKVKLIEEEKKDDEKEIRIPKKIPQDPLFKIPIQSKRHNSVFNPTTLNFSKKFNFFNDQNYVEIIDEKGNIKKEKIKYSEKENKEFKEKRKKNLNGEFKMALEFHDKIKEEDDDEQEDETINNTIKNQFASQLRKLDGPVIKHKEKKEN